MANLGTLSVLAGRNSVICEDKLNHASLLDGAILSRARLRRYGHGDMAALAGLLNEAAERPKVVVSDGVFSMDGDLAPLPELVRVSRETGACLMIDDAHALGVLGEHGGGTSQHFGLGQGDVPVLMGTLGKALGTFGAFVAGAGDLIDYLAQTARTYIYTTALPPAVATATLTALRIARRDHWRRDRLMSLVQRFRRGATELGLRLAPSTTPIQVLMIGGNQEAEAVGEILLREGFWVSVIRPPTVPVGTARLRITFSAAHEAFHVDGLLAALERLPLERSGI
jgi:8-amino-7-oxononanoate synthase